MARTPGTITGKVVMLLRLGLFTDIAPREPTRDSTGASRPRHADHVGMGVRRTVREAQVSNANAIQGLREVQHLPAAVRPADATLAALLENKETVDEVPLEAWWHIAESLRHSIAVRRDQEGIQRLETDVLDAELHH